MYVCTSLRLGLTHTCVLVEACDPYAGDSTFRHGLDRPAPKPHATVAVCRGCTHPAKKVFRVFCLSCLVRTMRSHSHQVWPSSLLLHTGREQRVERSVGALPGSPVTVRRQRWRRCVKFVSLRSLSLSSCCLRVSDDLVFDVPFKNDLVFLSRCTPAAAIPSTRRSGLQDVCPVSQFGHVRLPPR